MARAKTPFDLIAVPGSKHPARKRPAPKSPNAWTQQKPKPAPAPKVHSQTRAQRGYTPRKIKPKKPAGPSLRQILRSGAGLTQPVKAKPAKLKLIPGPTGLTQRQARQIARTQARSMGIHPIDIGTPGSLAKIRRAAGSRDPYTRRSARQLAAALGTIAGKQARETPRDTRFEAQAKQGKIKPKMGGGAIPAAAIPLLSGVYDKVNAPFKPYAANLKKSQIELATTKRGTPLTRTLASLGANALADAVNLPVSTATSVYLTGSALNKAAKGDPSMVKAMGSSFLKNDPVALAAQGKFKQSVKVAREHPLNTALEVKGAFSAASKGAGAALRRGPQKARLYASRTRAPEEIYGGLVRERSYSSGIVGNRIEKRLDRRQARQIAAGHPRATRRAQDRAESQANKLLDEEVAVNEGIRREHRDKLIAEHMPSAVKKKIKGLGDQLTQHERDIFGLAVDRTVRSAKHVKEDLTNYRDHLVEVRKQMEAEDNPNRVQIHANERMVERIDNALAKGVNGEKLFAVADEFVGQTARIEKSLIARGILEPRRAARSKEVPFAVRHLGAREIDPTPEWRTQRQALAADLRHAQQQVGARNREHATARVAAGRAHARAEPRVRRAVEHRLMSHEPYREARAARTAANAELTEARRVFGNAARAGSRASEEELIVARRRLIDAQDAKRAADSKYSETRASVMERVTEKDKREPDSRPEGTLRVLEREHGKEAAARVAKNRARERAREAKKALREHDRSRPPNYELRDRHGNKLTAESIRQQREAMGVGEPGFYAQKIDTSLKSAAMQNKFPQRGALPTARRTGEATHKGTFDPGYEAAYTHLIRSTGLRDWSQTFDRIVNRFQARGAGGHALRFRSITDAKRYMESDEYQQLAAGQKLPEMVPIRTTPFGSTNAAADRVARLIDDASDTGEAHRAGEQMISKMFTDARDAGDHGHGPVVLVPKHIWERAEDHYTPSSAPRRASQVVNNAFKNTVLPTSPKWIAGNVIDNTIRLLISGVGPRDFFVGRKLIKELEKLDPEAAELARVRMLGGMHFSTRGRMQVHRDPEDFSNAVARWIGTVGDTRGARIAFAPWRAYRDFVFHYNAKLENVFENAALGRVARTEVRNAAGKWESAVKIQPKAMQDLASGLRGTDAQIKFAREIRGIVGNWNTYGPLARKALFDVMPFGAWLVNALKFVYVTMPRRHPVMTGLLAANANLTREQRKQLGLEPGAQNAKPDFLQGGIPHKGGTIGTQGLTSFGFAGGIPGSLAAMPYAPFQSSFLATKGLDWKGSKITNADGSPLTNNQKTMYATYLMLEALTPMTSLVRQIREQGGKSAGTSTALFPKTKPGSKKGYGYALKKKLNPFQPTYGGASTSGGGKGTGSTPDLSGGGIPDLSGSGTPDLSGAGGVPDLSGR